MRFGKLRAAHSCEIIRSPSKTSPVHADEKPVRCREVYADFPARPTRNFVAEIDPALEIRAPFQLHRRTASSRRKNHDDIFFDDREENFSTGLQTQSPRKTLLLSLFSSFCSFGDFGGHL